MKHHSFLKLSVSNKSPSVNVNSLAVKRSVQMRDLLLYDASSVCIKLKWALRSGNPDENYMLLLTFVTCELLAVEAFYF